jgi:hypothetical protein
MQLLKRIQPLILSVTFVVCCLTFQADTFLPNTANAYASWITNSADQTKAHDVYKIKPRTSETILGNNFSIFSFKCFLRQRKSLLATNYKQQQAIQQPQQADYLIATLQTSSSEDDTLIG